MGSPGAALRMHWTEPRGGPTTFGALGSGHALALLHPPRPPRRMRSPALGPGGGRHLAPGDRPERRLERGGVPSDALQRPDRGEPHLARRPARDGPGGIAVTSDRVYVATMAPGIRRTPSRMRRSRASSTRPRSGPSSASTSTPTASTARRASCSGRAGSREACRPSTRTPSDATSASPVADEAHAWFTNAAGRVVCFTRDGETEWSHDWIPAFDGPFNKQFEPFLVQDGERRVLVQMLPGPAPGAEDPEDLHGRWHRLVGLDADTGGALEERRRPDPVQRPDPGARGGGEGGPGPLRADRPRRTPRRTGASGGRLPRAPHGRERRRHRVAIRGPARQPRGRAPDDGARRRPRVLDPQGAAQRPRRARPRHG